MNKYFIGILVFAIISAAGFICFVYYSNLNKVESVHSYKVGIIVRGNSYLPGADGFKAKMRQLGYEEGRNVSYLVRVVESKADIEKAVTDLLASNVDLLHTYSTPVTQEVYKQTKTVPVVVGSMGDPLVTGFIDTLQKPGKNVTGINSLSVPLVTKRLELLVEAFPNIKKIAMAYSPEDPNGVKSFALASEAGKKLGVTVIEYSISAERDVVATAAAIKRADVDGIVRAADSLTLSNLPLYIEQAKSEKLPFAVSDKVNVEQGGLMSYGPEYFQMGEQSAVLAHKIFKGAKPGELPVENPQLKLVVNLKTAEFLGVTFPDEFLAKADIIIK